VHDVSRRLLVWLAVLGAAGVLGWVVLSQGGHRGAHRRSPVATAHHRAHSASPVGRRQPDRVPGSTNGRPTRPQRTLPVPASLPGTAAQVAAAYATATYTWAPGETAEGWLSTLAPLASPDWFRRLERSDPTAPPQPTGVTVSQVLPAHAPRGEVGADVVVQRSPGGLAVVLVDLSPAGAGWTVVKAS
jgi:hypothetical protein